MNRIAEMFGLVGKGKPLLVEIRETVDPFFDAVIRRGIKPRDFASIATRYIDLIAAEEEHVQIGAMDREKTSRARDPLTKKRPRARARR